MSSANRNSPLWTRLSEADTQQQANVHALVDYAEPLLDLIRDTFPTYTLHNHTHAENVIGLMEDLLGERIKDVRPLEAAILILSAYFHDIGMVYSDDERDMIQHEQTFADFVNSSPKARTRLYETSPIPNDELVEQYCRAHHAERVYQFLHSAESLNPNSFDWRSNSILNALGLVCESHNWPFEVLTPHKFDTTFLGNCDLLFVATILRIADILDFDNSRSPDSIYQILQLSSARDSRGSISNAQWRNHLCCDGFHFERQRPGYRIKILAAPDHPAVESDIRSFTSIINTELSACATVIKMCGDRWIDFQLPSSIDTSGIVSKGYLYDDFQFTLDRDTILELFMGENLYSEPMSFIRELLQNAIDATRSRSVLANTRPEDEGWAIECTSWLDSEGYVWFRVDDQGIGMDLSVIKSYLLNVGRSYYSSDDFRAELAAHRPGFRSSIVPISRFGVGLLSCFLVGDRVEISTKKWRSESDRPPAIRCSFDSVGNFAIVQTNPNIPNPMPNHGGLQEGYRSSAGTSVAVRIDPKKFGGRVLSRRRISEYLTGTEAPISIYGHPVSEEIVQGAIRRWNVQNWEAQISLPKITSDARDLSTHLRESTLTTLLDLELAPADGETKRDEIRGIGYALLIDCSKIQPVTGAGTPVISPIDPDPQTHWKFQGMEFSKKNPGSIDMWFSNNLTISCALEISEIPDRRFSERIPNPRLVEWSHNGIMLPDPGVSEWATFSCQSIIDGKSRHVIGKVLGILQLSDSARPDLNISRDRVQKIGFALRTRIELQLRRSVASRLEAHNEYLCIVDFSLSLSSHPGATAREEDERLLTLKEIADEDSAFTDPQGWPSETLFDSPSDRPFERPARVSALELIKAVDGCPLTSSLRRIGRSGRNQFNLIERAVLQLNTDLMYRRDGALVIASSKHPELSAAELEFPPFTFIRYQDDRIFLYIGESSAANSAHPLSKWLMGVSIELKISAPAVWSEVIQVLHGNREIREERGALEVMTTLIQRINRSLPESERIEADRYINLASFSTRQ